MAEYRLYCFAQSGNAYKAALMLALCGADWEPRFVDFFKGEARSPQYLAINEMGEVPVLERGELRLSQSGVILDYLAEAFGRFGGRDAAEGREILRWILFDNHKLTASIATLRYLLNFAPRPADPAVLDFLRGRMKGALGVLERHLEGRDWVAGPQATIADLSLCGYLFWPDEYGEDWAARPAIAAWLERIRGLPGWVHPYELMPGHPLGKE